MIKVYAILQYAQYAWIYNSLILLVIRTFHQCNYVGREQGVLHLISSYQFIMQSTCRNSLMTHLEWGRGMCVLYANATIRPCQLAVGNEQHFLIFILKYPQNLSIMMYQINFLKHFSVESLIKLQGNILKISLCEMVSEQM